MIQGIVYKSHTGFTEKYAKMLAEELDVPAYPLEKCPLEKKANIVFLGWVMAGGLQGYKKAKKKYTIQSTCAVGMCIPNEKQANEIQQRYSMKEPFFYLQGGFSMERLSGIYKFIMQNMRHGMQEKIRTQEQRTQEEMDMLDMLFHGKDCTKKEYLLPIINCLRDKS